MKAWHFQRNTPKAKGRLSMPNKVDKVTKPATNAPL